MISRYVDQDLDRDEKSVFELHINQCPACRKELEEQLSIHGLLVSAEKYEAPIGFTTRVMARIEEKERRPSFWSFFTLQPVFLRAVEVAFALVIILIGMVSGNLLFTGKAPERPMTVQESFSLDLFQATPPGSISGAYMALAEGTYEK